LTFCKVYANNKCMKSPDIPFLGGFPPAADPNAAPADQGYRVAADPNMAPPTPEELKAQVKDLIHKVRDDYVPTVDELQQYGDFVSKLSLDGNKQMVKGREREGLLVDGQAIPTTMSAKGLKRLKEYVNPRERVLDGQEVVYLEAIKRGESPDYFKSQASSRGVDMDDHDTAVAVANTIDRQLRLHDYAKAFELEGPRYGLENPADPRSQEVYALPYSPKIEVLHKSLAQKAGEKAYQTELQLSGSDVTAAIRARDNAYEDTLHKLNRRRETTLLTSRATRVQQAIGDKALALTGADGKPVKGVHPMLVDESSRRASKPAHPAAAFTRRMKALKEDPVTEQNEQLLAQLNDDLAYANRLNRGTINDEDVKRYMRSYGFPTEYTGDPADVEAVAAFRSALAKEMKDARANLVQVHQAGRHRTVADQRAQINQDREPAYWLTGRRDRHMRRAMAGAERDSLDRISMDRSVHDDEAWARQRREDLEAEMERRRLTAMYGSVTRQILASLPTRTA
jgi:hypothetical protein